MTLPWESNTTTEIASSIDARYETPGGAQNKVNISQDYILHLLKLAVTGLSDGSESAVARYSEPYNITYDWLKDRLDAADLRDISFQERLDKTTTVINVKSYGAIGDGVTDDTVSIKNAILAAIALGIMVVYFPSGTYKITDTLLISSNLVTLRGEGEQSIIEGYTTGKDMINVTSGYKVTIAKLSLRNLSASASKTVNFSAGEAHILDSCSIRNIAGNMADIVYYQGANTKITNNGISNYEPSAYCIHTYASAAQLNINTDIIGNYLGGVGEGILIDTVDNLRRPEGIKILHNTILLTGSEQITIKSAYYIDISHNIIDVATNYNIKIAPEKSGVSGLTIDNNFFGNSAAFGKAIGVDDTAVGALSLTVSKNFFSSCGYAVFGESNLVGITVDDNKFSGVQQTSITLNGSRDVVICGNEESSTNFSLYLTDGLSGGPFIISNNKFIGSMAITKTTETRFKFLNNIGLSDTYGVTAVSGGNKIQSGSSTAVVSTPGTAVVVNVTFPTAFATLPVVTAGINALSTGESGYTIIQASASTTGITFRVNSYVAQTISFGWIAVGT